MGNGAPVRWQLSGAATRAAPAQDHGGSLVLVRSRAKTVTESDAGEKRTPIHLGQGRAAGCRAASFDLRLCQQVPQVTAIRRGLASSALASAKVKTPSFISALILF